MFSLETRTHVGRGNEVQEQLSVLGLSSGEGLTFYKVGPERRTGTGTLQKDLSPMEWGLGLTSLCVLNPFSHVRLCDPMDCSPLGSSVHGVLQARILGWVAMPFSRVQTLSSFCFYEASTHLPLVERW